MQHIKVTTKSLVEDTFEIFVPSGKVAKYIPANKYLSIPVDDPSILGRISENDELIIVEYSGFTRSMVESAPFCRTVGSSTTIETEMVPSNEPDSIGSVFYGTAVSIGSDGEAFFIVDSDISQILNGDTVVNEYVNLGTSRRYHYVRYLVKKRYYSVSVGLNVNEDFTGMNMESNIETIMSEAKEGLIPPILDLEKIKFSPVYKNGEKNEKVKKILLRFNFLHRDAWTKLITDTNVAGFNYARTDSWGIDNLGWYTDDYTGETTTSVRKSSKDGKSTLIGFLGFTDGDVRFQKNKLAKSFARLSYYSTNDLIDNSLLNFSTVFMDSGELFGKYVKIEKNGTYLTGLYEDQQLYQYIHTLSSGDTRLDCTLYMTDEYDEKKSGEGFNIYLFGDDFEMATENEPGTIYMKVEFNHAGFGKVLQMMRPKVNGGAAVLPKSVQEYADAVFIPISVFYEPNMERFVYTFNEDAVDYDDGVIYIDLYEATITEQKKGKNLC